MKRVGFNDLYELSQEMIYQEKKLLHCISAICKYEIATALLSELIRSDIPIGQIDICDYSWNAYDKEFIISIMDGNVYCNPAFDTKNNSYYETYADVAFVHQDCNSRFLKYLDCENVYEFAVREMDEIDDEDIVTYHSDYVSVRRDKLGNPIGFTRQWNTNDKNGTLSYRSYSFYCDNEDTVRYMAEQFNIEL